MKPRWIFFDIDNTLFGSRELALRARENAIEAMIDSGLPAKSVKEAYEKLKKIIEKQGSNYGKHFNELVESYGLESSHIVAAGVVAYHNTKFTYLHPYPDVVPTLLELEKQGYKLGIITNGRAVKQWDKLIRLGVHHFFNLAIISEEAGFEKPAKEIFEKALEKAECKSEEAVMVGDKESDMVAKELGMKTICIGEAKADFNISKFGEILGVVDKLGK